MKTCHALLAGALLSACAPTGVSTAPPGAAGDQPVAAAIPARFQGTWTPFEGGKHPPGAESPTRIGATTWQGHESSGEVKSVRIAGENEVVVTLAMTGEGENWVDTTTLRLSPDGTVLTLARPGGQPGSTLHRVR